MLIQRFDGRDCQAGIVRPDGQIVRQIALFDLALATSARFGTIMSEQHKLGHVIDTTAESNRPKQTLVSINAGSADLASTACCLLDADNSRSAVPAFDEAEIEPIT